jgi:TPR repeat protein
MHKSKMKLVPLVALVICFAPSAPAWAQAVPESNSVRQFETISSAALRPPAMTEPHENIGGDPRESARWQEAIERTEALIATCQTGRATACVDLGDFVLDTARPMVLEGTSRPSVAVAFLEHACMLGQKEGCEKAADLISNTDSLKQDTTRFASVLQRGCQLGAFASCSVYGAQFFDGSGGPADAATAINFMVRGCTGGDIAVCAATAQMLTSGVDGVAADPTRAAQVYQAGCGGDDAVSCYNLAMMQLRGRGVPVDEAAGIVNLQRAHAIDPNLAPAANALRRRGLIQ